MTQNRPLITLLLCLRDRKIYFSMMLFKNCTNPFIYFKWKYFSFNFLSNLIYFEWLEVSVTFHIWCNIFILWWTWVIWLKFCNTKTPVSLDLNLDCTSTLNVIQAFLAILILWSAEKYLRFWWLQWIMKGNTFVPGFVAHMSNPVNSIGKWIRDILYE